MIKVALSSIIDIISGGTPQTSVAKYWENGTIGWLSVTDFNNDIRYVYETEKKITEEGLNESNTKLLQYGDIIISARGTVGALAQIGKPMCFNQSCFGIRGKNGKVDNDYLYYALKNYVRHIKRRSQGSVFDTINLKSFDLMEIQIPKSIFEQKKIAKILSDLDAKIEINNRINTELETMAKTLYDYWFVQFDFPYVTSSGVEKPYKSSGGKMVWNEELKRKIPEGWEVNKLKEIAETGSGGTPLKSKKEYFENGTIPWINSGEVNASFIISSRKCITQKGLDNSSAKLFQKGTILMAMYGATAGKVSLINLQASTNQAVCGIIPHDKKMIPYLKYGLHQLYDYLINLSSGSARDNLSQDKIKELYFVIPEEKLLDEFYKIANSHFEMILKNLNENQELASLRDWLLPMLMNGQVRVGEVEEELGMVAESSVEYQLNLTDKDKKIRRKMLATYIINQSLNDTSFGKTKFEKLLHLIECHIVKGDYNQRYSVQAAGPYDGGFTKVFWNEVTKAKWFKIEEFGKLKRIIPSENHSKSLADYGYLSDDLKLMINDFIGEFKNTNYERPEIVSTLYAVWNNRIIRNEMISDELLKKDFLEWDTQKARYKDRLDKALEWMRENAIVPDGWGNEIRRAKK